MHVCIKDTRSRAKWRVLRNMRRWTQTTRAWTAGKPVSASAPPPMFLQQDLKYVTSHCKLNISDAYHLHSWRSSRWSWFRRHFRLAGKSLSTSPTRRPWQGRRRSPSRSKRVLSTSEEENILNLTHDTHSRVLLQRADSIPSQPLDCIVSIFPLTFRGVTDDNEC